MTNSHNLRNVWNSATKQLWSLIYARAHQQAAIGSTNDGYSLEIKTDEKVNKEMNKYMKRIPKKKFLD